MRLLSGDSGRRMWGLAPYLALLLVVSVLVLVAYDPEDDEAQQPRLHDNGVWVVNDDRRWFGRLDKAIGQLDATFWATAGGGTLDVVQQDAAVVGYDQGSASLSVIDPAVIDVPSGETVRLPAAAEVQLRGRSLAVVDEEKGSLWATSVDPATGRPTLLGIGADEDPFASTEGGETRLAVTTRGTVVAVSVAEHTMLTVPREGGGLGTPVKEELEPLATGTQLTTVGETPVLLAPDGTLTVPGGIEASLPAESGLVLQQPGPQASGVLVATGEELLSVDLGTGEVAPLGEPPAAGSPVAPVRLGACSYAAWGAGDGAVLTRCDGSGPQVQPLGLTPLASGESRRLTFRTNRGQIVLNDNESGEVWDVTSDLLTSQDDWQSFENTERVEGDPDTEQVDTGQRDDPDARDDRFEARSGRTTVVHPLDNDVTPDGQLLRIANVSRPHGGRVTVSPDGQLVQVRPEGRARVTFDYTVTTADRHGKPDTAHVVVDPAAGNEPPALRRAYEAPQVAVAPGGVVDVPLVGDWRDPDGDPVALVGAELAEGGGSARVLEGGLVRVTAPPQEGTVTLGYTVSDGTAETTEELQVRVLGPEDAAVAPVARPDITAGPIGQPIQIRPLANDLAGADPGDPGAQLTLAAPVEAPVGTEVATDEESGTITLTSEEVGSFLLSYSAGFGNAPVSQGLIRVDVRGDDSAAPLTMPDDINVYGSEPAIADVLANDSDPAGGVLTVESVTVPQETRTPPVSAAVVEGRYIRVTPLTADLPTSLTLTYTVTNGVQPAEGELRVFPRSPPADRTPVTATDHVSVRSGGWIEVPVLDNDVDPSGGELTLVTDVVPGRAGVLPAEDVDGRTAPEATGVATVSGDQVRFLAPTREQAETITVEYVVANGEGDRATGRLVVEVSPATGRNLPPTPPRLEARTRAAGTVELELPGSGVDVDGDPVSITGISAPPTLGRVVEVRADAIVYQAFPDSTGSDEFGYEVTDSRGGVSTGTVRVGVVPLSLPEPPQAVPDEVQASPGSSVVVDVVANDYVAADDTASVSLPQPSDAARLVEEDGTRIEVQVPAAGSREVVVPYELSNGAGGTTSTLTVHAVEAYDAPPVVDDVHVAEGDAGQVTVDLLEAAYDPDARGGQELEVLPVGPRPGVVRQRGQSLTLKRGERPRVIPFQVRDDAGGTTTATVFVGPRTVSRPEVRPDTQVEVSPGRTVTERLAEHVTDPAGRPVRFTLVDQVWATPAGLSAEVGDRGRFTVTADPGMSGPGAVSFEVTTKTDDTDPTGRTQIVTIPVQVGTTRPVLTCSEETFEIGQLQTLTVPVDTLCHVWTADPEQAESITLEAEVVSGQGQVTATVEGRRVELRATGNATDSGAVLALSVSAGQVSSETVEMPVQVIESPPPRLAAVDLGTLDAGRSRTLDLAGYFTPGIQGSSGRVLGFSQAPGLRVSRDGGSRLRVQALADTHGRRSIQVRMTDTRSGTPNAKRIATARIGVVIRARPDRPSAPVPGKIVRSQRIPLTWGAPASNGAPIDRYQLRASNGRTYTCRSTSCVADGLENNRGYTFRVRAHNAVGWSEWSATSRRAFADDYPGAVGAIRLVRVGDGMVELRWSRPTKNTSITGYRVSWPGRSKTVRGTSARITGLSNNQRYLVSVSAYNTRVGVGPVRRSGRVQSIGTPAGPRISRIDYNSRSSAATTAISVSWGAVRPNGPGPVRYTLFRNGRQVGACRGIQRTQCTVSNVAVNGQTVRFHVRATNAGVPGVPGGAARSRSGGVASEAIVGSPANWSGATFTPTGRDAQIRVRAQIPPSRGRVSRVSYYANGERRAYWSNRRGTLDELLRVHDSALWADRLPRNTYLKVCNEHNRCKSTAIHRVQTYGPLRRGDHLRVTKQRDGQRIRWKIWVDNNGQQTRVRMFRRRGDGEKRQTVVWNRGGPGVHEWWTGWRTYCGGRVDRITISVWDPWAPKRPAIERTTYDVIKGKC